MSWLWWQWVMLVCRFVLWLGFRSASHWLMVHSGLRRHLIASMRGRALDSGRAVYWA